MSAYPAYLMGALCVVGGITGYVRTRSIPSIVAGVGVGALYLWSADSIRKGTSNGLEAALGASALLLLSSLPRVAKGPVPLALTITSTAAGCYYGSTVYQLRRQAQA
ncbi:transmembrane proteins 14C-domain-containing protein [Sparassis latifolia]|uniref:TMEM14 protein homolog n=1 Tax=Sparassis crispa TaxID=139825 RepID=A0A401H5B7_9APHY|nr:TMEM14 protein homolog [Sparassis crispa]GBE89612.1 TMEM14 protein homolog [Sparassis crispa]